MTHRIRLITLLAFSLLASTIPTSAEAPPNLDKLKQELEEELKGARLNPDQLMKRFEDERKAKEEAKRQAALAAAKKIATAPPEDLTIDNYTLTWHLVDLEDLRIDLSKHPDRTDLTVTSKRFDHIFLELDQAEPLADILKKTEDIQKQLTQADKDDTVIEKTPGDHPLIVTFQFSKLDGFSIHIKEDRPYDRDFTLTPSQAALITPILAKTKKLAAKLDASIKP